MIEMEKTCIVKNFENIDLCLLIPHQFFISKLFRMIVSSQATEVEDNV